MKTYIKTFILSVLCAFAAASRACPTCVARIEKNSPPFFEDEDVNNLTSTNTQNQKKAQAPYKYTQAKNPAPKKPVTKIKPMTGAQ